MVHFWKSSTLNQQGPNGPQINEYAVFCRGVKIIHAAGTTRPHPAADHSLNHASMMGTEEEHGLLEIDETVDEPSWPRQQREFSIGFNEQ